MNKLMVPPDQNTLTMDAAPTHMRSDLGEVGMYSEGIPEGWSEYPAAWTVGKKDADYLIRVNRAHENSGHVPFLIDLPYFGEIKECLAIIVPGTFNLRTVTGETFSFGCKLIAKPQS